MKAFAKVLCVLGAGVFTAATSASAAPQDWRTYTDPVHGARALFPSHLFSPAEPEAGEPGVAFLSGDGHARLAFAAWKNSARLTPGAYKKTMLRKGDYSVLTYQPRGRNWFVLSGYRGDKIYYQKVIYSCRGSVISAFAISYPTAQRTLFDPVVERMEDHFRAGQNC
jgi:hypothetical protein